MNTPLDRNSTVRPNAGRGYLNAVLTANALLLGVIALGGLGFTNGFASVSNAQTSAGEEGEGRTSAAEQRKQMMGELQKITARLDKIDSTLNKGVNVNVKNFPADFGKSTGGNDSASNDESKREPEIKKSTRPAPRMGTVQPK